MPMDVPSVAPTQIEKYIRERDRTKRLEKFSFEVRKKVSCFVDDVIQSIHEAPGDERKGMLDTFCNALRMATHDYRFSERYSPEYMGQSVATKEGVSEPVVHILEALTSRLERLERNGK